MNYGVIAHVVTTMKQRAATTDDIRQIESFLRFRVIYHGKLVGVGVGHHRPADVWL